MIKEKEIWKPCPGFEKWYDVSDLGNVRSYHIWRGRVHATKVQRIMALSVKDYIYVGLSKGIGVTWAKLVHVLVAKAFVSNPHKYKKVHHKDNDKHNPRADNLEWVTSGKNQEYAYADGQRKRPLGELNGRCKLRPSDVLEIFNSKENSYKLAAFYGVNRGAIGNIKTGKKWSHLTGKKYQSKNITVLTDAQVIEILNSLVPQKLLAIKYNVSQSRVSAIKSGRSYSELTGVRFNGRTEYEYYGLKSTVGNLKQTG